MAAGTYTLYSVIDHAKLALENTGLDAARLTDAQYAMFMLRHVTTGSGSYSFESSASGYAYRGTIYLDLASTGAVTDIPDDTTWVLNATGSLTQATGTTYTGSSLTVTGSAVDFNSFLADILEHLAIFHAEDADLTIGTGSLSGTGSIADRLMKRARILRGAKGV